MTAIFKRELRSYYCSITGYVIAAVLLAFIGIYTMTLNLTYGYPNFEYVLDPMNFVYMVLIPLLTMRLIAEERRQKTDLLLYALPLNSWDVAAEKFLAACTTLLLPLVVAGVIPVLLGQFGEVNYATAYAGLFAFFLLGCTLISIGLFFSALTESQLLAGVVCFLILLMNFYSGSLAAYVSTASYASFMVLMVVGLVVAGLIWLMTRNMVAGLLFGVIADGGMLLCYLINPGIFAGLMSKILSGLCIFSRMTGFINGIFDVRAVVYFLSVIGVFLFLTVQALEKRRWS